jgi:hypothetical protein
MKPASGGIMPVGVVWDADERTIAIGLRMSVMINRWVVEKVVRLVMVMVLVRGTRFDVSSSGRTSV